jgi:hypothetical protein
MTRFAFLAFIPALIGCVGMFDRVETPDLEPPTVVLRDIANAPRVARGTTIDFSDHEWLYIPEGYEPPPGGAVHLTVHFHAAAWFVIEEHWRRGARNPIFIFSGFEGSTAYRVPYEDRHRLGGNLRAVERALADTFERDDIHVRSMELQSFSAGYGAIREIVKSPRYVEMTTAVVLGDSMYASWTSEEDHRPLRANIAPWFPIARRAARGEMQFLVCHSDGRPSTYAGTPDTAEAVVKAIGGHLTQVEPNSIPSADPDLPFPLATRYDRGGFHVWGYGGDDPIAHMAQARTMAEFWNALEQRPMPPEASWGTETAE